MSFCFFFLRSGPTTFCDMSFCFFILRSGLGELWVRLLFRLPFVSSGELARVAGWGNFFWPAKFIFLISTTFCDMSFSFFLLRSEPTTFCDMSFCFFILRSRLGELWVWLLFRLPFVNSCGEFLKNVMNSFLTLSLPSSSFSTFVR